MLLKNSLIIIMVLAVLSSGCATSKSSKKDEEIITKSLEVAMSLKFQDVPIPAGFKSVDSESFSFQNEAMRVGIMKFIGRANADNLVSFYKEQMPLYNWRFLNMIEYDRRILSFDRSDQSCIVAINQSKLSTVITITVAPKAGADIVSTPEAGVQKSKK